MQVEVCNQSEGGGGEEVLSPLNDTESGECMGDVCYNEYWQGQNRSFCTREGRTLHIFQVYTLDYILSVTKTALNVSSRHLISLRLFSFAQLCLILINLLFQQFRLSTRRVRGLLFVSHQNCHINEGVADLLPLVCIYIHREICGVLPQNARLRENYSSDKYENHCNFCCCYICNYTAVLARETLCHFPTRENVIYVCCS